VHLHAFVLQTPKSEFADLNGYTDLHISKAIVQQKNASFYLQSGISK